MKILWNLEKNTILQVVFVYELLGVPHQISFFYVLNEDCTVDPCACCQKFQNVVIDTTFNKWASTEVTWLKILLTPSSQGVFTWLYQPPETAAVAKAPDGACDITRRLRFSLIRYNREKPIFFAFYGIPENLKQPTRQELQDIMPWFSDEWLLAISETVNLSLGFRGTASAVQTGETSPVIDVVAKFVKIPDKQQATYRQKRP